MPLARPWRGSSTSMGLKTAVLASGGMSHYPGTDRYAEPDLAWDKRALERLAAGNLKSLIGYDAAELDASGNVELRCWACAAGMLGERKPDIVSFEPSWHHNYASLGWSSPPETPPDAALPVDQARTGRTDGGAPRACA